MSTIFCFVSNGFGIATLCVLLLFTQDEVVAGGFLRGDSAQDGNVDVNDVFTTLEYLYLGTTALTCLDAADANDDGAVDIVDPLWTIFYLFVGAASPPDPGPDSPGEDPTPDDLDCEAGGGSTTENPPTTTAWFEWAPPIGTRERQGNRLAGSAGDPAIAEVGSGVSFVLIVQAIPSFVTFSAVTMASDADPRVGDPASLRVTVDRDLGDPSLGGVAAGENLAPLFLNDIDLWEDPIRLELRAALRIDGATGLAPDPGRYVFTISTVDDLCSSSSPIQLTLDVLDSAEPEVHFWLEGDNGGSPDGVMRSASGGSGGLPMGPNESAHLFIAARPNGKANPQDPAFAIDESSFAVSASWPVVAGSSAGEDIVGFFTMMSRMSDGRVLWSLLIDAASGVPSAGNVRLSPTVATNSGVSSGEVTRVLEVEVSYAEDVQVIWNDKCSACHDNVSTFQGLEIVNLSLTPSLLRRNIVNVFASQPGFGSTAPLLVWPHETSKSYLWHKIKGTHLLEGVLGSGFQMPADGNFLDDVELHLVEGWIGQGAVDN